MKTLLLWDIDGTLTDSNNAGTKALRASVQSKFGITDSLSWLQLSGRTDVWIARQILEHHLLPADDQHVRALLDDYLSALPEYLKSPEARVLPGVRVALTEIAQKKNIAQGLLTGNLAKGAEIKLSYFGLNHFFAFGAFADDSAHRNDLGPHAIRRAAAHHGVTFEKTKVVVIGDTPHDIACGQAIRACTFGVATGRFSEQELRDAGADVVFSDFSDTPYFLAEVDRVSEI